MAGLGSLIVAAFVSAVTASVLGWCFNRQLEKSRRRAVLIDKVCDEILSVTNQVESYWADDRPQMESARGIRSGLHRITKLIGVLRAANAISNDALLSAALVKFRQAATGGEFETVGRSKDLSRVEAASSAGHNLIFRLLENSL